MTPETRQHIIYALMNAPIRTYPCPHFYVENVFPAAFYQEMLAHLPTDAEYTGIRAMGRVKSGEMPMPETRFVFSLRHDLQKLNAERIAFWKDVGSFFLGDEFNRAVAGKFWPYLTERFPGAAPQIKAEPFAELFRDKEGYFIGPHTDHPTRLFNIFFYLPANTKHPELGTSFYVPENPALTCEGGPHYGRVGFTHVYTAPYMPNSAAGFFKNNKSFHGVEPLKLPGFTRNVLGYYAKTAA